MKLVMCDYDVVLYLEQLYVFRRCHETRFTHSGEHVEAQSPRGILDVVHTLLRSNP